MSTALLSSYRQDDRIGEFAAALKLMGWEIYADHSTQFPKGVRRLEAIKWDLGAIMPEDLQIGLASIERDRAFDLVVINMQPLNDVIYRLDPRYRLPVMAETFRSWIITSAIMGFRPVVVDPNDLPRVKKWIDDNELNGDNLRWLWAKAQTHLALRHTELAQFISYGTSPSGMILSAGLPDPESAEWATAKDRVRPSVVEM